jgi:hypothetical protein
MMKQSCSFVFALVALVTLLTTSCGWIRATGDTVEAVGDGLGHAVEETGDAIGRAASKTEDEIEDAVN